MPGLTEQVVNQHFPESEEALRGHMQKNLSGLRSTEVKIPAEGITNHDYESDSDEEDDENSKQPAVRPRKKHRDIFVRVIGLQDELREKIYIEQTGNFPVRSSQGNQYLKRDFLHHGQA